ncbi:MAG: diaminopimelate decarboxylase [Planctomycetes bacterium]|nr:diaminopimelate decarboxylase [Planctomycetota bacterium]
MEFRDGRIWIGGASARELAERYGTPLYVYDETRIRSNFRRVRAAFESRYTPFRLFYAIKASNNPAIARILRQEGAGIDAASVNEILLARHIGAEGQDVIFTGNNLSDEDIREALETGAIFNLDDASTLPRLLRIGTPSIICFRINPGYGESNVGEFVTNAGPDAKFGIHPDQVEGAYRAARDAGIRRFGVHMMPGSCVTKVEYFPYVVELLMDIAGPVAKAIGIEFEFIDLGGGLGIPYRPGEAALDLDRAADLVVEVFRKKIEQYGLRPPTLKMEPARILVGDAGWVIGRVHSLKHGYRSIIGTDIGMNVLARPAFYKAYHHIYVDGKEDAPRATWGVCGQICENTDFWVRERQLPANVEVGDLVVVENAGAYGFVMSYAYNGRLRPAEVLVREGTSWLIRERETFEDTIRNVRIPDHLRP